MEESRVKDMMRMMASRIEEITERISDREIADFIQNLLSSDRIYLLGVGRSGLVSKAFAMRLMHLGLKVFVVGETVTPSLKQGDLLIIFSRSGETESLATLAKRAKELGAKISLISTSAESRIGKISDHRVIIHEKGERIHDLEREGRYTRFSPLGTLFETAALVFADAIISRLMEITETDERVLKGRHANLE